MGHLQAIYTTVRIQLSVLMPGVEVGREARVIDPILDKNVAVPDCASVGVNLE